MKKMDYIQWRKYSKNWVWCLSKVCSTQVREGFLIYVYNNIIDHFIGSYKYGIERFKDSCVTATAHKAYNHLVSKSTI